MTNEKQLCLSDRLQTIADLIPTGSRVADIGTDHAYLPVWLLQNGVATHAVACDVNEGPLERARGSAAQYGITENISFRLGNGLACVAPEEVDTIAIAGMGGETMIAILEAAPWTREGKHKLLLQPMTKAELLRPWLAEYGYRFIVERLVFENQTYFPVMMLEGGGDAKQLTPGESWGGILLQHDPLQGRALDEIIRHLSYALAGLEKSASESNREKAEHHRALIAQLQKMKEAWLHDNG